MDKSLLVISSYPRQGQIHGSGTVGIASYTKNTLLSILESSEGIKNRPNIIVLAEKLDRQKEVIYKEEGIEIRRIWQRNSIFSYFRLISEVIRLGKFQKVLIEFELSMFGHFLYLTLFPLFIFILKIFGKEIIFVSHQVVDDINLLSGHIGIENKSIEAHSINILISLFYKLTFLSVSKIIVFEDNLKVKLSKFANKNKIVVIPHGVEQFDKVLPQRIARNKLGLNNEFVVLYFGFIAWYKGTDWLVDRFSDHILRGNNKIKLIIAGGANPNHKNKQFYTDYLKKVELKVEKLRNIQITNFVEEKDIPLYFNACDLVILPYRTLMSSSGPLSLASSFQKPFLFSRAMIGLGETEDFFEAIKRAKIGMKDLSFNMTDDSLDKKIIKLIENKSYYKHLLLFAKILKTQRSFEKIGKQYYQEILK